MLINRLKFFVLAAVLLFSDYFFINESIRLPTLAMALLVVGLFFTRSYIPKNRETRNVLIWAFAFILYMGTMDYSRGADLYKTVVTFLSALLIVSMLPAFESQKLSKTFILGESFVKLMWVSVIFAALQAIGLNYVMADLLPGFFIVGADRIVEEYIDSFSRTSGATSNTIAFASQLSIMFLFGYAGWIESRKRGAGLVIVISAIALITTQARAMIFGIIPIIAFVQLMLSKNRARDGVKIIVAFVCFGLIYLAIGDFVMNNMTYLSKEIDSGDTHRFLVNWYMAIGVMTESPWFGIAPEKAWEIYLRYGDTSIYGYNPDVAAPTHHNQLGYYFRYYGLVGIFLLSAVYISIFIKIFKSKSYIGNVVLTGMFFLDFVYSMAHNNRLMASPLLWIMLSLASSEPKSRTK